MDLKKQQTINEWAKQNDLYNSDRFITFKCKFDIKTRNNSDSVDATGFVTEDGDVIKVIVNTKLDTALYPTSFWTLNNEFEIFHNQLVMTGKHRDIGDFVATIYPLGRDIG